MIILIGGILDSSL